MRKLLIGIAMVPGMLLAQNPTATQILDQIDKNMASKSRIFTATMVVHAARGERVMEMKIWSEGDKRSFTEYLAPAREKGTKMLKLDNQLWIFSPATDRVIQISGHMLRQSVMGSDMSYEDMMDDRKLSDVYNVTVTGKDTLQKRDVLVLELVAKVSDIAYYKQKMWIDAERYVPLRQEMYARSGQLLKRVELTQVKRIQNRWYPSKVVYKDMLNDGKGTEFVTISIKFDQPIPEHIFSKASLR